MSGTNALQQFERAGAAPTIPVGGQVQFNPLAAITAGNQAAQSEFQTRQWQARQAAGQAYQGAINPETGEFDPNRFRTLLSQSGPAALAAGEALANTQQIGSDEFNQTKAKTAWVNSTAGSLTRLGPNITQDHAMTALRQGLTSGMLTPAQFARQAEEIRSLGNDPAKLNAWANQHQFTAMTVDKQLEQTYGTPFREDQGGRIVGGTQAPARMGGGLGVGPGAIDTGLSPQQRAMPVEWPGKDGRTHKGTLEEMHRELGIPIPSGPAVGGTDGGGGGPLSAPLPPGMYNDPGKGNRIRPNFDPVTGQPLTYSETPPVMPKGARPDSPSDPTAARAPLATPPANQPRPGGGKSIPGQSTAERAAQETTGTASANKFQAIVDQGVKARSQDALLATMLGEAQGFRPGPGADLAATIKRTILGAGAQFGTNFGIDEKKLASMESVIKIGNQLADAQGAGSDARLRVSEGANPSIHNTAAGLDLIVRQLRGNADYLRARQQLAAAYPDKDKIEDFEAKIAANLDPRVFHYQRMTGEKQRREYFETIAPADRAAFKRAHKWAEDNGLIGG